MSAAREFLVGEVVERLRRSTVQVRGKTEGCGSGVIWSSEGRIVTNAHVVQGAGDSAQMSVEVWDGRVFPARVASRDRRRDLAVLEVQAAGSVMGLAAAAAGDSSELRVGEMVIAVGNPLGFTGAASTGVVHSMPGSGFRLPGLGRGEWVISQLRLAPGNSGGPLANARGEVVGINTMIAGGLAFAIPSRVVKEFLAGENDSAEGLGVVVRPVPVGTFGRQMGLIVLEVLAGSAAERASILQGDVLVGANGKRFQSVEDLGNAIEASRGGTLELQFRRGASDAVRNVVARMAPASPKAA